MVEVEAFDDSEIKTFLLYFAGKAVGDDIGETGRGISGTGQCPEGLHMKSHSYLPETKRERLNHTSRSRQSTSFSF